jgi:hypothetical protein
MRAGSEGAEAAGAGAAPAADALAVALTAGDAAEGSCLLQATPRHAAAVNAAQTQPVLNVDRELTRKVRPDDGSRGAVRLLMSSFAPPDQSSLRAFY